MTTPAGEVLLERLHEEDDHLAYRLHFIGEFDDRARSRSCPACAALEGRG